MTDRVMTEERRNELAALLDDDQRLRADYPKVAEYLDMAPRLQGTSNPKADAAFDLRLVHYVVGGKVNTTNPYWDIVGPSVSQHDGRRVVDGGQPGGSPRLAYAQMLLQAIYAYAVPSPETIKWMAAFCEGGPLLELGAGRGYWAALLARAGLTVQAYDSEPPDTVDNISFPRSAGQRDVWHEVSIVDDVAGCVANHPGHVLLLCWPPGWGNEMAVEALAEFERTGGERLLFVGEPQGGMNATDSFFAALSERWRLDAEDAQFVSWWNLSDVAQAWSRR